jgi:hypothetical protein
MRDPVPASIVMLLYPFPFRDAVTRKWLKARYVAARHEFEARAVASGRPSENRSIGSRSANRSTRGKVLHSRGA